jgi:hypothetical protein
MQSNARRLIGTLVKRFGFNARRYFIVEFVCQMCAKFSKVVKTEANSAKQERLEG